MVQRADRGDLTPELVPRPWLHRHLRQHHLQRNQLARTLMARQIHDTLPAAAQLLDQVIAADLGQRDLAGLQPEYQRLASSATINPALTWRCSHFYK